MKIFSKNIIWTLEPINRLNLLFLFCSALGFWVSVTSLLPTLPTYIQDIGGSLQQVGLVTGSFAIGLLISRPFFGQFVDKYGRKYAVLVGTFVVAIATLGYIFTKSIFLIIVLNFFLGLARAAFATGYTTLVVDLAPAKHRGEIIGYLTLATPIGLAIGPALGGFLQEWIGYIPLFITSSGFAFLAFFFAYQTKENFILEEKQTISRTNSRSYMWGLFSQKKFYVPVFILFLIGFVMGTWITFLPLFVRSFYPHLNAGWFFTTSAIASFSSIVFMGKASDSIGRGRLISFSLFCYCFSMLLIFLNYTSSMLFLSACFKGIAAGILIPTTIALISDRAEIHQRGQVYSICLGGLDIGMAIAGSI